MQISILLSSLLVTLFTAGVVATPAGVEARDIKSQNGWDGTVTQLDTVTSVAPGAAAAEPNSLTDSSPLTPGDNDVPVAATDVQARDLESFVKRTPGCLFATRDRGFKGPWVYICLGMRRACYNWNSYWRFAISSFSPDQGTVCRIYTGAGCTGTRSVPFGYPGYGNLGLWNDNMGSFRCTW
ncbi:hypothetical protein HOY80DRAFT_1097396 [Tuber brumale]|nr:hypothetical protein HOY80DRAFT_1097396 [Tuber brumale]